MRPGPRGAAAVEFAVVAPLLLALIFGTVEVGRAIMVRQVLINTAREGARMASTPGYTLTEVQSYLESYLQAGLGLTAAQVSDPAIIAFQFEYTTTPTGTYPKAWTTIIDLKADRPNGPDARDPVRVEVRLLDYGVCSWLPDNLLDDILGLLAPSQAGSGTSTQDRLSGMAGVAVMISEG